MVLGKAFVRQANLHILSGSAMRGNDDLVTAKGRHNQRSNHLPQPNPPLEIFYLSNALLSALIGHTDTAVDECGKLPNWFPENRIACLSMPIKLLRNEGETKIAVKLMNVPLKFLTKKYIDNIHLLLKTRGEDI